MSTREDIQAMKRSANAHCDALAWPTIVLASVVLPLYFLTPVAVVMGVLPVAVGTLMMAFLAYAGYTALHESVHGAVCGGQQKHRWVNELIGYMAGLTLGVPLSAHRYEHFLHHNHTNKQADDPDLICTDMTQNWWRTVASPVTLFTNHYGLFMRGRWPTAHAGLRWTFVLETAGILVSRALLLALLFGPVATASGASPLSVALAAAMTLVVGPILGTIMLVYLFAYLVHIPHSVEGKFKDTSIFVLPAWLRSVGTWLWGFQNYHGIHHAFPRLPWYRYREVYEANRELLWEQGMPTYALSGLRWRRVN